MLCAIGRGIKAFLTTIGWSCNASELAEVGKYGAERTEAKARGAQ